MNARKFYWTFALLWATGMAWVAINVLVPDEAAMVPHACMFKAITHLPCPSCGSTRAILALGHGNLAESLAVNPLGLVVAMVLVVVPLWMVADGVRGTEGLRRAVHRLEDRFRRDRWLAAVGALLVVANWIWNIVKGV